MVLARFPLSWRVVRAPVFASLLLAAGAPPAIAAHWRVDDAEALAPGACAFEAAAQTNAPPQATALLLCGSTRGEWVALDRRRSHPRPEPLSLTP